MAYGLQSIRDKTGNFAYTAGMDDYSVNIGSTQQIDLRMFCDFSTNTTLSTTSPCATGTIYGINGGGGAFTLNASADRDLFGAVACFGVVRLSTGTTSNSTGYAGFGTATVLPGFPTPSSGFTTKYEIEARIRTDTTIFTTAIPGRIKIGFASTMTNATPNDGVYFEWNQPSTGGDTTWNITYYNDGATVRVNTGVAFAASKTYSLYLCVSKDSSGNYTTQYRIVNTTDSTDTGLSTASPSGGNAAYPSDTADVLIAGAVIMKQTTTTTTARGVLFDYFSSRWQLPLTRQYMNLFV